MNGGGGGGVPRFIQANSELVPWRNCRTTPKAMMAKDTRAYVNARKKTWNNSQIGEKQLCEYTAT